jgi:hypothetical protein
MIYLYISGAVVLVWILLYLSTPRCPHCGSKSTVGTSLTILGAVTQCAWCLKEIMPFNEK